MSNYFRYDNKVVFHPGNYIEDEMKHIGYSQEEFALRLGTTPKNLSLLLRGEQSLSLDIAIKLEKMIGVDVETWMNLQMTYDRAIIEYNNREELAKEIDLVKKIDYKIIANRYNLDDTNDLEEQVKNLRVVFNISSLTLLNDNKFNYWLRNNSKFTNEEYLYKSNIMVLQACNTSMNNINISDFNKRKFNLVVKKLLKYTIYKDNILELIKKELYDVGIDLIIEPNIDDGNICGAVKKTCNHIMLMISDKNCYFDSFWHVLMHELAHILNGDYKYVYDSNNSLIEDKREEYARNALIPNELYKKFVDAADFSVEAIKVFAQNINRDPSLVVSRLLDDNLIDESLYDLFKIKLL